jgi:hypothetical protein
VVDKAPVALLEVITVVYHVFNKDAVSSFTGRDCG